MNLKVRLALLYSLSVFIILMASAVTIYILNENFRESEFNKRLTFEAEESYKIFSEQPHLTPEVVDRLNQNAVNSMHDETLSIYDSSLRILYNYSKSLSPVIPAKAFQLVKSGKSYSHSEDDRQSLLLYKTEQESGYYVLISAFDVFGHRKSENLKILLASSVLGSILLSGILAFFYVRQAMKPLEELKNQIEKINEGNLTERIAVSSNNNEITQIAKKFNAMLDRLEQAFEQRKSFVQHASHELRTPLANMLSQTEAALSHRLETEDYRKILYSLKEDQQNIIDLTNSLLTLSRYEKITFVKESARVRIDEVLYQSAEAIHQTWPDAVISINFEIVPENEDYLYFEGNESLIKSAVQNLIKNAVQYSDNLRVTITILAGESGITLHFDNTGKQLSAKEQERLFIPFFRGENSQYKKGYGLGLSIVQRIISVHDGTITYNAVADNINRFTLFLPAV